jgi:hypothetical protein
MIRKPVKALHLLGLALFLGSIPAHILLGRLASAEADLAHMALLLHAKHVSVLALTLPGLALIVVTGLGLVVTERSLVQARWLWAKLGLAAFVMLNGALILTPTSAEIAAVAAEAAATGVVPPTLAALQARESLFGALNLMMTLSIIALAVLRPGRRGRRNVSLASS